MIFQEPILRNRVSLSNLSYLRDSCLHSVSNSLTKCFLGL